MNTRSGVREFRVEAERLGLEFEAQRAKATQWKDLADARDRIEHQAMQTPPVETPELTKLRRAEAALSFGLAVAGLVALFVVWCILFTVSCGGNPFVGCLR